MSVFVVNRKKLAVGTVILMLIAVLAVNKEQVVSVVTGNSKPIYSVKTETKQVALTFDISWGEENVQPILDILKKENIKATFFLSSPWAETKPELVKHIAADGHEIGSHGRRHVDLNTLTADALMKELDTSKEVLERLSDQKINLLRAPNGAYDNQVISVANERGYKVIQWSVDSLDWKRPGADAIVNYVMNGRSKNKGASPGDIILFHASDSAPDTPEALPTVLKMLKEKNYEIVTVGKLLSNAQESWPPGSSL
ncbi:MAG: polysaccharide deacetylase family sporulation protein PdaB [Dehalobacter sp. 4CP]|uniref:polysaccharide deacetylase family sporulation protein PdaB n=1 Tax=Dehalobacter sp. CP TaxID=2594474 RepID=UPI0013C8309A|nr:polysaccharide deacetylase family sporulation protein PdaB [Dehalobacter sp. 4CP]